MLRLARILTASPLLALAICACSDDATAPGPPPGVPADELAAWERAIDTSAGAVFHLDPRHGHLDNPGTAGAPWPDLADVLAADLVQRWEPVEHPFIDGAELHLVNPDAPVAPGDNLLLRDGDHGACTLMDAHNPDFLAIRAADGAAPVLRRLELIGVEKLVVAGLTIRAEKSDTLGGTLLAITSHGWRGPCREVSVRGCAIASTDDIAGWSADDWNARAATGVSAGGDRLVIRDCTVRNVNHGVMMSGDEIVVERNLVENFCGDGLRGLGNDQLFAHNTVRNCYAVNGNHDDGFQSFSVNGQPPRERVTLRGNVIIGYTDPDQPHRGTLQGIGCFDGFYVDWVIENNLVVTDHWHGITLLGADGCRVVNNTVADLNDAAPGPPWIMIGPHKDDRPSRDCLIRNNVARTISASDGVAADHNLEITDLAAVFADPAAFDFTPRADGPAVDAGTAELAPPVDLNGRARPQGAGVDLGAIER